MGRPKNKKPKRQPKAVIPFEYVKEECCKIPSYDFVGLTKNIIKLLSEKTSEFEKKGYKNIVFDKYDTNNYALYGERIETEHEYKRRVALYRKDEKKKFIKNSKR